MQSQRRSAGGHRRLRTGLRMSALAGVFVLTGRLVTAASEPAAARPQPARMSDFNGDGYRDLAVGAPGADAGSVGKAGTVGVAYGSANGIDTGEHQTISEGSPGVPGGREPGDRFGETVAAGDFDADGYADLAIGAPAEQAAGVGGRVTIVFGSASGLSDSAIIVKPSPGGVIQDVGEMLAAGDFNGDAYRDLAIYRGHPETSSVNVLYGRAGLRDTEPVAEALDTEFIRGFAAGDVTGDGYTDLVVARWDGPDIGPTYLTLYGGSSQGLSGPVGDAIEADLPRRPAMALGDVDGDTHADLAVTEGGDVGGGFSVYRGTAGGIDAGSRTNRTQASEGVPGVSERHDGFGSALAINDLDSDGCDDVAAGVPGENDGKGWVAVLYTGFDGVTCGNVGDRAEGFSQDTANVPGHAEISDRFGAKVTVFSYSEDDVDELTIAAPGENEGSGVVHVLPSAGDGPNPAGSLMFGAGTLGGKSTGADFGTALVVGGEAIYQVP